MLAMPRAKLPTTDPIAEGVSKTLGGWGYRFGEVEDVSAQSGTTASSFCRWGSWKMEGVGEEPRTWNRAIAWC